MVALLNALLEISAYSGILFLAIFIFKKVFHKHISAMLNYMVWILLILRLLMPFTIDSHIRLFVIPKETAQVIKTETESDSDFVSNTEPINENKEYTSPQKPSQRETYIDTGKSQTDFLVKVPEFYRMSWEAVVVLIWVLGIIGYFIYISFLYVRFRKMIRQSLIEVPKDVLAMVEECKKELGIKTKIPVMLHNSMTTPAITLALRPILLLPERMLGVMSREQIKLCIRHELTHYMGKDYLVRLLLLLLRGVYWFNPVVWVAYRMILADMETACDARVTARFKKEQRDLYIHTIIDLGRSRNAFYAVGMGETRGKKNIERRIRGMFMKKKSKRFVMLAAMILVPAMLIICFTTACQPTPESQVVQNKADGELMAAVNNTSEASTDEVTGEPSETPYNDEGESSIFTFAPIKTVGHADFNLELPHQKIYLTADADITMPDTENLPVYSYRRKDLNQNTADNIFNALLGDKPFYEYIEGDGRLAKSQIENYIVAINYDYKDINSLGALFSGATSEQDLVKIRESELEEYYNLLEKAPDKLQLKEQDKSLSNNYVIGWTPINDDFMAELRIISTERGMDVEDAQSIGISYSMMGFNGNTLRGRLSYIASGDGTISETTAAGGPFIYKIGEQPNTIRMTPEEAIEIAEHTFKEMGAGNDVKVSNIYYVDIPKFRGFDQIYCYGIELKRCAESIPIQINHSSKIGAEKDNADFSNQFTRAIPYERMTVFVNDLGIIDLQWSEPIEEIDILNKNIEIAPTDEIIEEFKKQFLYSYSYAGTVDPDSPQGSLEYNLYNIDLSYSLARIPNQEDVFMAIPLWEFYATVPIAYFDRDMNPFDGNSI